MTPDQDPSYDCVMVRREVTLTQRLEAVKTMLTQRDDTVTAWCHRAGISTETLNKYMRQTPTSTGGQPDIGYRIVLALADAAGVDRAWLFCGADTVPRTVTAGRAELLAWYREEVRALAQEEAVANAAFVAPAPTQPALLPPANGTARKKTSTVGDRLAALADYGEPPSSISHPIAPKLLPKAAASSKAPPLEEGDRERVRHRGRGTGSARERSARKRR